MVTVVVDGVVTSSYRYTTLEDVTETGDRVPTRTGSRFAAPRFRARCDCRQRRAVADAVAEPEPRTAHSPPSSRPQSVSNMRPFSDPPKRDKDCVATRPASRTQHRQRVFTASEERLSAVGPRSSPASPTRPQSAVLSPEPIAAMTTGPPITAPITASNSSIRRFLVRSTKFPWYICTVVQSLPESRPLQVRR